MSQKSITINFRDPKVDPVKQNRVKATRADFNGCYTYTVSPEHGGGPDRTYVIPWDLITDVVEELW